MPRLLSENGACTRGYRAEVRFSVFRLELVSHNILDFFDGKRNRTRCAGGGDERCVEGFCASRFTDDLAAVDYGQTYVLLFEKFYHIVGAVRLVGKRVRYGLDRRRAYRDRSALFQIRKGADRLGRLERDDRIGASFGDQR